MESISFKAKITGDISNLEKVLKVAEGQVRKLSDDEVLIKLAYDGNIKAFNKVFDGILKSCPELSIQFQYDVNKQLYLKELNKLESMQKLKIGIDSGDLKAELKEDMNSILAMWDNGESEDKISGHLSNFRQKVANALKGGLLLPQNFMEPLEKMAEDSDTLMRVFDREYKPTIDLSNIKAQEARVKDISDHLDKLKDLGASDSGILSDTDIKIINDLNDKVVNLGERVELIEKLVNSITFDSATKSVDSLNSKLDETSKKVVDLQERLANPDNLTFHVGDFEGRGYKSEGFHRMISNMNAGGYDEGDVGFGVIGTGVYHTQNYSDLMMGGRNPKGYLLNIDPSKYNLLVAETNEEAEKLLQFLSDLQGFVIKMGSGYSAWDETLQSVDADSLYKRYTEIFKTANLDFKEFEGFLDFVVSQVKEASANGIDDEGFKDIPEKYVRADNIATQFLKRLGYGGVSLKGTQYDSYEQGNTVFDLDPNDIIKTFSSQGEMEDYGEKLAKRIQDSISTAAKNIDAGELKAAVEKCLGEDSDIKVNVVPDVDKLIVQLQAELDNAYVTIPVRPQDAQAFVDSLREMVTRADIKFSLGNVMLMPDEQPAVMARVVPDMEDFTSLAQAEIQGYSDPIKVPVKPEADEESVIGFAADLQKRLNQLEPFKIKVQPWNEDVDAISTSGEELLKESSALTSVFSEALKAAKAKEEFTKANAKLADGAKESSVAIADEYEQLGKIDIKSISATAQKTINGLFGDQPVDIYKQRRKDADGRYNVSYRVVGQDKTAYIGQNGTVLRDSERVLDNLTKEKALRKELQELERQQEKEEAALNAEQIKRFQAFEKEQSKYLSEQSQKEDEADRLKEQAIAYGLLANAVKDYGRMLNAIANGDYSLGDKDDAATLLDLIYEENDRLGSSKLGSKKLSDDIMNQIVKAEESAAKATEDFYSRQENAAKTSAEARIKYEKQVDEMWQKLLWKREQDEAKASERSSEKNKSHNSSALDKLLSYGTRIDKDISDHKYVTEFADRLKDLRLEISAIKSEVDSGAFDFTTDESVKRLDELNAKLKETYASAGGEERAGNVTKLESNIKSIYKTLKDNSAMSAELRAKYEALANEMESYSESADISAAKTSDLTQRMIRLDAELLRTGQTGKGAFDIIGERLTGLNAQFIAQYFSIQDWIRYFRQAAQTVIELDTALTELRKVSDASTTRLQQSFRASAETAKELGSTISDVINVTADWSRLGETIDNAEDLARVTTLFKNVGDNITAEDASSYMISAMKGFKMQADEAEHIVDVYNEVANNFAIDTAGIGEAIKRSAASFAAANTSIEESVALVTAANSVAQDPASIGTAFKTMSARIRASKVELQELGEEEDAVVESTASLQKYIKGITGFDILEKDGKTFKSLYDILLGIGKEFQNLDDVTKAALSEKLFGKRMGNIGLAVLNDTEQLEAIYEKAMAAEGSAMREQENYAKSVQYSIDQLKASAQELANDVINSQFLKGGIEALTKLVNILDQLIKQFGILGPLVAGIGVASSAKSIGVQNIVTALMGKSAPDETVYKAGKEIISKGIFDAVDEARKLGGNIGDLGLNEKYKLSTEEAAKAAKILNDNVGTTSKTVTKATAATSMFTSAVVSLGVAAAAVTIYKLATAANEIKDSAIEAGRVCNETAKDFDEYKSRIVALQDTMKNSDSYEESYQAQQDLYELQRQMMAQYGDYAGIINVFGDNVDQLTEKFEKLKIDAYSDALDKFNSDEDAGFFTKLSHDFMNFVDGYDDNLDRLRDKFEGDQYTSIFDPWALKEGPQGFQEFVNQFDKIDKETGFINADLQETYDTVNKLIVEAKKYDDGTNVALRKTIEDLERTAKWANSELTGEEHDTYNKAVLVEDIFGENSTNASKRYQDIINQKKLYDKAIVEQNEKEILAARDRLLTLLDPATMDGMSEPAKQYLSNLLPELQGVLDARRLELKFEANEAGIQRNLQNAASHFENTEQIKGFVSGAAGNTQQQEDAYEALLSYANANGFAGNFDGFVDVLAELVDLSSKLDSDFSKSLSNISKHTNEAEAYTKNFTAAEKELWLEAIGGTQDGLVAIERYKKKLKEVQSQLKKTFTVNEATEATSNIISMADAVGQLMVDMHAAGNGQGLDVSGLKTIQDTFKDSAIGGELDTWISKLNSARNSASETELILQDMLNEWIRQEQYLDQTGDAYEILCRALEEAGFKLDVLSREQRDYLDEQWETITANQQQAESAEAATEAMELDIAALEQEAEKLGISQAEWINYYLSKYSSSGSISTSGDIAALAALIAQLDEAQKAWIDFYKARADLLKSAQTHATSVGRTGGLAADYNSKEMKDAVQASYENQILAQFAKDKTSFTNSLNKRGNALLDSGNKVKSGFDKNGNVVASGLVDYIDQGIKAGDEYAKIHLEEKTKELLKLSTNGQSGLAGYEIPDRIQPSGSSGSSGDSGSKADEAKEKELEWIQQYLDAAERARDELERIETDESKSYATRIDANHKLVAAQDEFIKRLAEVRDFYQGQVSDAETKLREALPDIAEMIIEKANNGDITKEGWKDTFTGLSEEGEKLVDDYLDYIDQVNEYADKIYDEQKNREDQIQREFEHRLNKIKAEIDGIQNEADAIQHSIDMRETTGRDIIREADYEDLIDNADQLASKYYEQLSVLEDQKATLEEGSAAWYNVVSQIYEVDSALRDVEKQQAEWNETIKQLPIRRIQRYLQMLENIKKDIQNFNSEQSTLGVNPNQQSYTDMFNIGTQQITKYKEELDKLQANLKTYKYGTDKFEETANAIQECQDNVSSLIQEMREYNTAILNIPVDKINEVVEKLQAIQDAMQKVQDDNNTAIEAAITLLSDQMDKNNKQIEENNKYYDKQRKAIEEARDANKEQLEVEKARYALAKAQGQLTNKVLKNGEWVWQADPEALRDAAQNLRDAEYDKALADIDKQNEAANKALEEQNELLEKSKNHWEELRTNRDNALTYDTAGDIFGDQNWEEKVLSGNDDALWNKMDQSYEKYLRGIDAYSKTIEDYQQSTALMSTYIAEYNKAIAAANNIQDQTKREQAIRAASDMFAKQSTMLSQDLQNGLTAEENLNRTLGAYNESSSASALNNSANIISTALGEFKTYFGIVADQNVVLSGYAQTWQDIHDSVLAQIEELKALKAQEDAALELRRQHLANSHRDSDRDAKFQQNVWRVVGGGNVQVLNDSKEVGNGYYEKTYTSYDEMMRETGHHGGIKTGYIGHMNRDEQLRALDMMASAPLKKDDVPSLLQEGEVVLTQGQQANLLSHLVPLDESDMLSRFTLGPDVLNLNAFRTKKLKGGAIAGNGVQMQQNFNFGDIHVMEAQNVTDIAKGIMNGGLSQALTQQLYKR